MKRNRLSTCFGIALLTAASASAQQAQIPLAPALPDNAVTLSDAVGSTIARDPRLALDAATLQSLTGSAQETEGLFDSVVRVAPSAGFMQEQLAPGLRGSEAQARGLLSGLALSFTTLTAALQAVIRGNTIVPLRCPSNVVVTFGGFNQTVPNNAPINVDRIDPTEQSVLGTKSFLQGTSIGDALGGITLANVCTNPAVIGLTPENYFQALRDIVNTHAIDQSGGQGVQGFLNSVSQVQPEAMLLRLNIAADVAAIARLSLERLGPASEDELTRTAAIDASWSKVFRNGISINADYQMQSQAQNFRDKPFDPAYGGLGQPPQFASIAGLTLNVPLGQGLGRTAVLASQRSARLLVEAGRSTLRHDATEEALRTTQAYLNVVAAQQTVIALQDSAARQQRIVQLTDQGVQVGELPRVENDRARARAARVDSFLAAARAQHVSARVDLANAMGIDVSSLTNTPVTTEQFSAVQAPMPPADALITRALSQRIDVRARASEVASAETLAAGARANLKRIYNLSLTGQLYNIYSSPVFRYLPDEQSQNIFANSTPVEPAINYYSPTGFYRALTNRYTPSVTANFTVQLPFGNWAAKGRLREAQASVSSARIDAADLNRTIRDHVVDLAGQLRQIAASIERLEEAVRNDEATMQSAVQLYQIRDLTLIDALTTEELATQDRIELIRQRQSYLSVLARLKFETGDLLTFESEGPSIQGYRFDPSVFVVR